MRLWVMYWGPVLLWMGLISYLSTGRFAFSRTAGLVEPLLQRLFRRLSAAGIVRLHMALRSAAHFSEYLILSLLVYRAVRADHPDPWQASWMWLTLGVATGFAIVDELHQKLEPGRTARFRHVLMDAAGVVAGLLVVYWFAASGR